MTIRPLRIAAVVVTHNRLPLLRDSIAALRAQTRRPDEIFVIDNASTDGTSAWLREQDDLIVFAQGNLGSAGGFHRGVLEAYRRGGDWFWLMDDDTIPHPDALEHLVNSRWAAEAETGFLNSVVLWKDGSHHPMNSVSINTDTGLLLDGLKDQTLPIENSSFVSMLVHRRAVEQCGLPMAELFIWYDDVEYTRRLRGHFRGFLVTASVVTHATPEKHSSSVFDLTENGTWKFRYGMRNLMYLRMTSGGTVAYRTRRALKEAFSLAKIIRQRVSFRIALTLYRSLLEGIFFFRPKITYPDGQ